MCVHLDLTSPSVELQKEVLWILGPEGGRLEIEALLLGTVQQSLAQVRLVQQQGEEVGC